MPKPTKAPSPNGHKPTIAEIPVDNITPSNLWPQVQRRQYFTNENLGGLVKSIIENGFQGAITARPIHEGYELVAGERRWLAAKAAGLSHIPATICLLSDHQALEFQLAENLERKEMTPLDEALTYKFMIDVESYTVRSIADKFAKSEKVILRRLKLGDIVGEGRKLLAEDKIPLKHAEFLATFPDSIQVKIIKNDLFNWDGQVRKLSDFISSVKSKYVLTLSAAPFRRDDAELHATAGACEACPKRTGFVPGLFTDTLGDADRCLDKSCWDKKVKNLILRHRDEIAATYPNPKKLPADELALRVPLIKCSGTHNYTIPGKKNTFLSESYSRPVDFKPVKSKKECQYAEKAVRLADAYGSNNGGKAGSVQLICRTKACEVHKPKEAPKSNGYDSRSWELQRQQKNLEEKCKEAARQKLLPVLVAREEAKDLFATETGRRLIVAFMIELSHWYTTDDLKDLKVPAETLGLIDRSNYPKSLQELPKLSAEDLNRLAAGILFSHLTRQDDADPVIQSAAKVAGFNYPLAAAEALVAQIPESKKEIATEFLEKVKKGATPKFPAVYWPEGRAKKAAKNAKAKEATA